MIFRDQDSYIVDQTWDGGDSANRAGLSALFGNAEHLQDYEVRPGVLVRHPKQAPWDNPKNFTRDQLLPFTAGAWKSGMTDLNRRIFKAHAKRLFFAQNFERDETGSRKFPWPHRFINDKQMPELRWFDFADPLGISDIWHLILCARLKALYFFAILGYPALAISILLHALFNRSNDEGQIISKAWVAGPFFVRLYKIVKPDWAQALYQYWVVRRQMPEMYNLIESRLACDER